MEEKNLNEIDERIDEPINELAEEHIKEHFEERVDERGYHDAILSIIRSDISDEDLKIAMEEYHDNDIASILEDLTPEERERLHLAIGNEAVADILAYTEDASEYLAELETEEVADIIEQMDADEALEVLDTLDEDVKQEVMELIEGDVKDEISLLDSYDDDEFGSRMSTNFIAVKRDSTIKKAMRTLVNEAAENDNISTIFVLNEDDSFYGEVDLKSLIIARSTDTFEDLITTTSPYVYDNESISENIENIRSYAEDIIPVLSRVGNKLIGVITANDITEIVDEEMGDDYAKLAALTEEDDPDESIFKSIKKRIPWLVILLFLGLIVSGVVGLFDEVVSGLPLIVCFQSLILGMAGNVGTQSLAVTVRSLGTDEFSSKEQLSLIFRETRVAFMNGLLLGIFSFGVVTLYLWGLVEGTSIGTALPVAMCVGLALLFAMTISGLTGATIPILFYRGGIDPAVASGPLITTINDLVAVVSYYGLALLFLTKMGLLT